MIRIMLPLAAILLLVGCQQALFGVAGMPPERLSELPNRTLCENRPNEIDGRISRELRSRNLFTDDEWRLINLGRIREGMRELTMLCSWGGPGVNGDINVTRAGGVTHKQYVYRRCSSCSSSYVYTRNGEVTGWQQ